MGLDWDGLLAYGYDLGLEESIEFEFPEWWDSDNEEGEGFGEFAEHYLVREMIGFTETWKENDGEGFYERLREAEKKLGLEIIYYCSYDYPGYILSAKTYRAYQGEPVPIIPDDLAVDPDWDDKLNKALEILGVKSSNPKPSWLLSTILS
jgi:hypothetical protein